MAAITGALRGIGVRSTATAKTLRLLAACMDICQSADGEKHVNLFFLIYGLRVPSFAISVVDDVAVVAAGIAVVVDVAGSSDR